MRFLNTWDLDFGVRPYEQLFQINQYWFLFRQLVQSSLPHYNPLYIIQILNRVINPNDLKKVTSNDHLNNFLVHLLHRPERLLRIPNLFYKLLSFFSFKRFLISHGLYTQRVGSKSILLKLHPRPFCGRKHFSRSQRISSVKWCVWSKLEMPPTLWCHQFEAVTNLKLSPIWSCHQFHTVNKVSPVVPWDRPNKYFRNV